MPQLRNISVHITDTEGKELEEWAVQHLPKHNKVSAYIKAQSNLAFQVAVQAKIPWEEQPERPRRPPDSDEEVHDRSYTYTVTKGRRVTKRQSTTRSGKSYRSKGRHTRNESEEESSFRHQDKTGLPQAIRHSSPIRAPSSNIKAPPYNLLATLYIDGRVKPERRVIIYLDPAHEDFNMGGKSQMKARWVRGKDGTIQEHAWVFNDIGIDTILDRLDLADRCEIMPAEDQLVAKLGSAGLRPEADVEKEEKKRVGQIKVVVERVVLREKWIDSEYQPRHREGEREDMHMSGVDSELTHTAGFTKIRGHVSNRVPVVSYDLYDEDEQSFATFQFFYRSQETLEKLIPTFPRTTKRRSCNHERIDANLSNHAPLSISQGLRPTSKSARFKAITYEDRVKSQDFPDKSSIKDHTEEPSGTLEAASPDQTLAPVDERLAILDGMSYRASGPIVKIDSDEEREFGSLAIYAPEHSREPPSEAAVKKRHALTVRRGSDSGMDADAEGADSQQPSAASSPPNSSPKKMADLPKPFNKHHDLNTTAGRALDRDKENAAPPRRGSKLVTSTYPNDTSSDADDEGEIYASHVVTHPGKDDQGSEDDTVPSQNRDDGGLHRGIQEMVLTVPGKRERGSEKAKDDQETTHAETRAVDETMVPFIVVTEPSSSDPQTKRMRTQA